MKRMCNRNWREMRMLLAGCLVLAVGGLLVAGGQAAQARQYEMTVATGHPKATLHIKWIDDFFIPEINRRLQGTGESVHWTRAYGGTVVKLGNELQAVRDNIISLTILTSTLSAGSIPLLQVTVRTPFGPGDPAVVSEAVFRLHQEVPAINRMWNLHNVKFLDGGATGNAQIMSRRPLSSVEDLQGMTIGAAGPVANWLRGTGAIPVTATLSQFYNDLRSGVYDAALVSTPSALAMRLHEVAPYIGKVDFGAVYSFILVMNKDVWESLSPGTKEVFQSVATDWRSRYSVDAHQTSEQSIRKMQEQGAHLLDLSGEFRKTLAGKLPNIAREWSDRMDALGEPGGEILSRYISTVDHLGGQFIRNWMEAHSSGGRTPINPAMPIFASSLN